MTATEVFERDCPYYMAIGMTYDQYWNGDVLMVRAFYRAYKLKQQMMNETAWLNGAYFLRALDATVGNMMRKKGTQPSEYPKQPIQIYADEIKKKEPSEADAAFAKAWMTQLVNVGKKWGKNEKG